MCICLLFFFRCCLLRFCPSFFFFITPVPAASCVCFTFSFLLPTIVMDSGACACSLSCPLFSLSSAIASFFFSIFNLWN